MRIEMQKTKWNSRVQAFRDLEKKEENQNFMKGTMYQSDVNKYLTTKMKKERSLIERINRPELSRMNMSNDSTMKRSISNDREEQERVELELKQLELKLKRAEDRHYQKQLQIMTRS